MTKLVRLVVPLLLGACCTNQQKTSFRIQEPADRWALAVSPRIPAPLEETMTELPPLTVSMWSLASAPVVFVTTIDPVNRRQWFALAETLRARLPSSGLLDLIYPSPSAIVLPDDYSGKKLSTHLVTAEARIFQ